VLLFNAHGNADRERECVETLLERRVDGIIFTTAVQGKNVSLAIDAGVRAVEIERRLCSAASAVVVDNHAAAAEAMRHLVGLGHRRIGFVGDTMRGAAAASRVGLGFVTSQHRLNGYRQALAAAEVCHDPALVRRGPHGPANAEALTGELLELPNRPSAIFAASDTQAMGVLAAAERYGIGVPRPGAGRDQMSGDGSWL